MLFDIFPHDLKGPGPFYLIAFGLSATVPFNRVALGCHWKDVTVAIRWKDLFQNVRPNIVGDDGETAGTFAPEVVVEQAMDNILNMSVRMSNLFEDQLWYAVMWYDMIWYDVMWCDVMWCDVMWYDMMWYDMIWCDVMCCDVMWCDVMWWYDDDDDNDDCDDASYVHSMCWDLGAILAPSWGVLGPFWL